MHINQNFWSPSFLCWSKAAVWSVLIPSGVIFSLQTILTCICAKTLFALFDKLLCERVCTKWKKKLLVKMPSHILLPTYQTYSLPDINMHYLCYLINIHLNWIWSKWSSIVAAITLQFTAGLNFLWHKLKPDFSENSIFAAQTSSRHLSSSKWLIVCVWMGATVFHMWFFSNNFLSLLVLCFRNTQKCWTEEK